MKNPGKNPGIADKILVGVFVGCLLAAVGGGILVVAKGFEQNPVLTTLVVGWAPMAYALGHIVLELLEHRQDICDRVRGWVK